ncbi:MAG: transcription elongation factor GreA [Candidatus Omnitrophica bacterium CG11_big_fil_rev_8_21_14_0_20_64_10]|nr:MAG: transcription elongation factor GreA [Candidatus Omnitrophica bacterium CG11_big_fil_rev_8_21_14_0_20_64_10]
MTTFLTPAGVAKLEAELKALAQQKRQLSKEVEIARAHGDLRENGEYHAAKERLTQVMGKIGQIQMKLADVRVVDPSQLDSDLATLGKKVTVKDLSSGKKEVYVLASPDEADPGAGRISVASPMGKAFLGAKAKQKVTAQLPGGAFSYQILSIEADE